jgi:ATP-dependent DNA ligase
LSRRKESHAPGTVTPARFRHGVARPVASRGGAAPPALPDWIRPQLTELVDVAPDGPDWMHEIKYDGYRLHARLDRGAVKLLTRTGLDWTHKYPAIANAAAEPLYQRPGPEILAVEVEKIEKKEHERRCVAAIQCELDDVESGDAVGTDAA